MRKWRENEKMKRKWREKKEMDRNGERIRKCREWISLRFLILSSFPLRFLIISPFSHSQAGRLVQLVQACLRKTHGSWRPVQCKKCPSFLNPNYRKLQNDPKIVGLEIGSTAPQKLEPFFSLSQDWLLWCVVKIGFQDCCQDWSHFITSSPSASSVSIFGIFWGKP